MPSRWASLPLADVVRLKRGFDLPSQNRRPGTVPILGSFGVTGTHDTFKVHGPGVTIGRSGASIGVATFSRADFWPLNTALYVEDFKGNDPAWVYWLLHTIDFSAYNSGSAQPSLNRNYLANIPVMLPPLSEQRRIAGVLGALDDLIELDRELAQHCEELAQSLTSSASTSTTLSSFTSWHTGSTVRPVGLIDHYSLPAFDEGRTPERIDGSQIKSNKQQITQPCVLVARLNPHIPRVWMVYPDSSVSSLASTEFVAISGEGVSQEVVFAVCSAPAFLEQMNGLVTGTTGSHQRVDKDALTSVNVPDVRMMPKEILETIALLVRQAYSSRLEIRELSKVRDELLPLLLSGRVRVREEDAA